MPIKHGYSSNTSSLRERLRKHSPGNGELSGWLFIDAVIYIDKSVDARSNDLHDEIISGRMDTFAMRLHLARCILRFGGAHLVDSLHDESITHVIVEESHRDRLKVIRDQVKR